MKNAVRQGLQREREHEAQQAAKNDIIEKLIDAHEFPVPEAFLDRQIENNVESRLRSLAAQGIDPRNIKLDWEKVRESQRERAIREVKAGLLLDRIAERESVYATQEEVDHEVQRIAKQRREPVAAVRIALEKDGTLGRIANHIRTEKVLNLLFENARKEAGE